MPMAASNYVEPGVNLKLQRLVIAQAIRKHSLACTVFPEPVNIVI